MKLIKTEDAVGHVLCHDMTRIVKGEMKGAQFKKGHVVTEEDIPMLLSMGKENIYVWENDEKMLHEDEAAEILKGFCLGENLSYTEPSEGKIEVRSTIDGFFKVDVEMLEEINSLRDMIIATRRGNTVVKAGDKVAAMRVVPLVIEKERMQEAQEIFNKKGTSLVTVKPFKKFKCGLVTTGSEVKKGRIKDTFTPVIIEKMAKYGIEVTEHEYCEDDLEGIKATINDIRNRDVDIVLTTGGMSVDPDDLTPGAIKASGADIVTYGAPVLPGAMFLLGYYPDGKVIMGLPGCVMYAASTIFDIVLPRVVAGEKVERKDLVKLGHGGLCLGCDVCHFPNCGFGSN